MCSPSAAETGAMITVGGFTTFGKLPNSIDRLAFLSERKRRKKREKKNKIKEKVEAVRKKIF